MSAIWTFPEPIAQGSSVRGYGVLARDGRIGVVEWADYEPGDSYLVIRVDHGFRHHDHVVPAGAVGAVDHERHTVTLAATAREVRLTPIYDGEPQTMYIEARSSYKDGSA